MDQKPINEQIKDAQLLVIDENGVKLGKMDRQTAINNAKDKGLDLILFVPANKTGTLSIAKIGDYGKYAYEQKIKAKQSKKKQTIISTKEVKVRPQIGNHDLTWRANQAKGWLENNFQIKFKIQAFGRIGYKPELIQDTYNRFLSLLGNTAKVITPLKKITPVIYEAIIIKNKG